MNLLAALLLAATPLTVDAQLVAPDGGSAVPLGEPFTLIIEARHAPGQVALLPERLELPGDIAERRTARTHQRRVENEIEIDVYRVELVAFKAGELTLPELPLALGSTVAKSPALEFRVATGFSEEEMPIASSTQAAAMAELEAMLAPDPDAKEVRVRDYTALWVGGGSILLIGLFIALSRWWGRRPEPEAAPPPPPRPAHEVALEALNELRAEDFLSQGDFHPHYVTLSAILRRWVGARYGFDSIELTIEELEAELQQRNTPGLDRAAFRRLVSSADLVKFAKHEPALGDGYADIDRAEALVTAAVESMQPAEAKA